MAPMKQVWLWLGHTACDCSHACRQKVALYDKTMKKEGFVLEVVAVGEGALMFLRVVVLRLLDQVGQAAA